MNTLVVTTVGEALAYGIVAAWLVLLFGYALGFRDGAAQVRRGIRYAWEDDDE